MRLWAHRVCPGFGLWHGMWMKNVKQCHRIGNYKMLKEVKLRMRELEAYLCILKHQLSCIWGPKEESKFANPLRLPTITVTFKKWITTKMFQRSKFQEKWHSSLLSHVSGHCHRWVCQLQFARLKATGTTNFNRECQTSTAPEILTVLWHRRWNCKGKPDERTCSMTNAFVDKIIKVIHP